MASKKTTDHKCIGQIDDLLAARGDRLLTALSLSGAPRRIYVATEKAEGKRGRPGLLAANFCPFCGEALP